MNEERSKADSIDQAELRSSLALSSDAMAGAVAMLAGIALLSAMDVVVKLLVTDGVSVLHILAIRSWLIVAVMLLWHKARGRLGELMPVRKVHQGIRAFLGILAPLLFFYGLRYLPLTDSVVVFFTSTLAVTFLSALILGEKVGIHRWSAVVVGYIGVIIAMRPSGEGQIIGYALALGGSLGYAYLFLSGRYLSQTETVSSLVFFYNFGVAVTSSLWILLVANELLVNVPLSTLAGIITIAALAVCGHYLVTMAFSKAQVSLIAPIEYTGLIWAIVFDYLIWQVAPQAATLIGAVIIIGSGLYVMHRERKNKALVESSAARQP